MAAASVNTEVIMDLIYLVILMIIFLNLIDKKVIK
jgi:hypothetical protein